MEVMIRIFKSWEARDPERRWVNNYEVWDPTLTTPDAFVGVMNDIVTAEKHIHLTGVNFLSATISTWVADSVPYSPTSFFTYELTGAGEKVYNDAGSGQALDSNVCYLVKKQTHGGRSGKLFYRGVLAEGDVATGGDGRFLINNEASIGETSAKFAAFKTALAAHITDGAGPGKIALISNIAGGLTIRNVEAWHVGRVTISKRNHRYFDRH